jgi:regulator of nucleoside diphosphate kinase
VTTLHDFHPQPQITVSQEDHRKLLTLAMAGIGHSADAADDLLYELERAEVRAHDRIGRDVVRMGSIVRYDMHGAGEREVRLVYPADADISRGAVSVLTPIGTALLGLRTGQSITLYSRDGRHLALTVRAVIEPLTTSA